MPGAKDTAMQDVLLTYFPKSRVWKLLMLSCGATISLNTGRTAEPSVGLEVSEPLLVAIRKVSPTANILQASDVNIKSCFSVPNSPTLVRADFNGDGREDVAVLLKTRVTDEIKTLEGQEFRKSEIALVIFLHDGKGGYRARTLDKFTSYVPIGAFIAIQPPGKIRPLGGKTDVTLSNSGVTLRFCERSAAVYTVVGNRVKKIVLSD